MKKVELKTLSVRVPEKAIDDLKVLVAREESRRGYNVTQGEVVADCLHGMRHDLRLDKLGRWQAVEHKHTK